METARLAQRSLRRLLANGPLTTVPKRPADQELVGLLAASRLDPHKAYSERELNEALEGWLETFTQPYGIDHVTLRRMLVDLRLVTRTSSGSMYRVNPVKAPAIEAVRGVEPSGVLDDVRRERETRRRDHGA